MELKYPLSAENYAEFLDRLGELNLIMDEEQILAGDTLVAELEPAREDRYNLALDTEDTIALAYQRHLILIHNEVTGYPSGYDFLVKSCSAEERKMHTQLGKYLYNYNNPDSDFRREELEKISKDDLSKEIKELLVDLVKCNFVGLSLVHKNYEEFVGEPAPSEVYLP